MAVDLSIPPGWAEENVRLTEFALTYDISTSDVRQMLDLGILEVVSTMSVRELMWAEGLSPEQGKAAYRAVLRVSRVV